MLSCPSMESLSNRQQSILNRVIDAHIETGQPVGSKHITQIFTDIYRDSYSPATVRHEMGILEQWGYLTHPHTSAGRVPTDRGYRYYVDNSVQPETSSGDISKQIEADVSDHDTADYLIEKVSLILATYLKEMGVTVLLTSGESFSARPSRRFYAQGTTYLLEKPEFRDVNKIRKIFDVLESKEELCAWFLDQVPLGSVIVSIGRENPLPAFQECTVVFSSYSIGERRKGALAVIGPRRMRYSRAIPVVKTAAQTIESFFKRLGLE